MIKIFKVVLFLLCLTGVCTQSYAGNRVAADKVEAKAPDFDWNPVMDAIIQVESEGDVKAVSGNSCGAMQITPILVAECNNILKKRKSKKRFTLRDRFSLFQSYFNPKNDIELAIRSWNGGMNFSKRRTQRYFEKVMKYLNM